MLEYSFWHQQTNQLVPVAHVTWVAQCAHLQITGPGSVGGQCRPIGRCMGAVRSCARLQVTWWDKLGISLMPDVGQFGVRQANSAGWLLAHLRWSLIKLR